MDITGTVFLQFCYDCGRMFHVTCKYQVCAGLCRVYLAWPGLAWPGMVYVCVSVMLVFIHACAGACSYTYIYIYIYIYI